MSLLNNYCVTFSEVDTIADPKTPSWSSDLGEGYDNRAVWKSALTTYWYVDESYLTGYSSNQLIKYQDIVPALPPPAFTSIGTTDKVGASDCTPIGTTPEIFLNSADYAKFLANGNCFDNGTATNKVSVIRDSNGNNITGTFYFTWFAGTYGCTYTTFKSTNGNISVNTTQC